MVLVVADRVQETTSTTGTSDYTLLGAEPGFQSFGDVMADADTTYYAITNDTDWEVGIGTYSTTGPTLARTTILSSSNSDAAVSWSAGTKKIFLSYAAERSVYLDESGDLSVDGTTLFVDATNDRVGIGTITPATKAEISGDTFLACVFSGTVTDTTLDVTSVSSGALAVGQYLGSSTGRVRITALGTGTGGVGTYTIDTNQNGLTFNRSYVADPTTTRLGNSQATIFSNMPHGTLEFASGVSTAGPRAYIQAQVGPSTLPTQLATMLFGVGANNGAAPPRTALSLSALGSLFPSGISLGQSSLSPRNLNISPSTITFGGRSQTIYTSGQLLSNLTFGASYIDASVETSATYGQIGYLVDSSITSGQLPSNFYISTRNASGTIAERFRINKDGNVGIGTSAPTITLDVNSGASNEYAVAWTKTSAKKWALGSYAGGAYLTNTTDTRKHLQFLDSGETQVFGGGFERMRINASGYVGIGTATPSYRLDVSGEVRLGGTVGVLKDPGTYSLDVFGYVNADGLAIGGTDITATAAELNYVDGVTSNIQTQLDSKGPVGGGSDAVFYENDQLVTTDYTIPANKNAMSTGPITVNSGVTVTVESGARYVVI